MRVKPDFLPSQTSDGGSNSVSETTRTEAGELATNHATLGVVEIAGQRYLPPASLAAMLEVTERTLCRWDAARIGPPKIKVGKLILYNLEKLPEWLETRETAPVRSAGRRR